MFLSQVELIFNINYSILDINVYIWWKDINYTYVHIYLLMITLQTLKKYNNLLIKCHCFDPILGLTISSNALPLYYSCS